MPLTTQKCYLILDITQCGFKMIQGKYHDVLYY
jgi:hypothetical protein